MMLDRKKYKGVTIDVFSKKDIEIWCEELECNRVELVFAILNAGKMADDVSYFISKNRAAVNKNDRTKKVMKNIQVIKKRHNENKI